MWPDSLGFKPLSIPEHHKVVPYERVLGRTCTHKSQVNSAFLYANTIRRESVETQSPAVDHVQGMDVHRVERYL